MPPALDEFTTGLGTFLQGWVFGQGGAKVQVEPLVDLPCVTQPPTKSYYWSATTQRHMTSKRSGKEWRWPLGGGGVIKVS